MLADEGTGWCLADKEACFLVAGLFLTTGVAGWKANRRLTHIVSANWKDGQQLASSIHDKKVGWQLVVPVLTKWDAGWQLEGPMLAGGELGWKTGQQLTGPRLTYGTVMIFISNYIQIYPCSMIYKNAAAGTQCNFQITNLPEWTL